MKIEKIKEQTKNLKQFINNLNAYGIYVKNNKKNIEIQLGIDRFLNLFKKYIKKMYIKDCEGKNIQIKYIQYFQNVFNDIYIYITIEKVKFFTQLFDNEDLSKVKWALFRYYNYK